MKSILVYRFSAFGDVLLCYPVLRAVLELNPELTITFVTQNFLTSFFSEVPRLKVVGVDLKQDHKGLVGIYKLSKKLKLESSYEAVGDLHQVTRTHLLNFFMGLQTYKVEKARSAKNDFRKNPRASALPHITERYLKVFKNMGLKVPENKDDLTKYIFKNKTLNTELSEVLNSNKNLAQSDKVKSSRDLSTPTTLIKLGFAPSAKHFTKTWPRQYLEAFIRLNQQDPKMHIYLFGGPGDEAKYFTDLQNQYPHVTNLAGRFNFQDEIALMQAMDQMVVMDSANMHLASLAGVPIISIWGGTDPGMGFSPIAKNAKILQVPRSQLPCRPCSVFGRADCPEKNFLCMLLIHPYVVRDNVLTAKSNTVPNQGAVH